MKHTLSTPSSTRGVTLLIAVLLSAAVLAVGIGVYQRSYKEILFSSFWKQAQVAFGAADGVLECALYFQLHPTEPPKCFGTSISGWNPSIPGSFQVNAGGVCARVDITSNGSSTTTKAYGYNVSCTQMSAGTNPRIIERGLEVTYGL